MNPLTALELERYFICQTDECEVFHACFRIIFGLPQTDYRKTPGIFLLEKPVTAILQAFFFFISYQTIHTFQLSKGGFSCGKTGAFLGRVGRRINTSYFWSASS